MSKAPSQEQQITIGFRVRRDEMPMIRQVAKNLRHKSVSAWVSTIFRRELNEQLAKMVGNGDAEQVR